MSCFLWFSYFAGFVVHVVSWLFVVALLVYFASGGLLEFLLTLPGTVSFCRTRSLSDRAKHRRLTRAARRFRRSGLQADRRAYQTLVRSLWTGKRADDYGRGLARFVR